MLMDILTVHGRKRDRDTIVLDRSVKTLKPANDRATTIRRGNSLPRPAPDSGRPSEPRSRKKRHTRASEGGTL